MNLSKVLKTTVPIRSRRLWAGLAIALGGAVALPKVATSFPDVAAPAKAIGIAAADIQFRGGDRAAVDRRFTLEILVVNPGMTPLKDVEILAQLDDGLELSGKAGEHRAAVESIAVNDLHIVRLPVTPRKSGPAGIDVTVRDKDGGKQQVRFVLPIGSADAPRPEPAADNKPLQFKFTPLKNLFVDQPTTVLMSVANTDQKPMANNMDLVVTYTTNITHGFGGLQPAIGDVRLAGGGFGRGRGFPMQINPIRHVAASLPALEAGESMSIPLRITPRRIGVLNFTVMNGKTKENTQGQLATGQLNVDFDPNAPVERLLPVRAGANVPSKLPATLAEVPEVSIEDNHEKALPADEAFEHVAHLVEKIKHVNKGGKSDAYMEAMIKHRSDVGGLPFMMGDACRLSAEQGRLFKTELERLRPAMANPAAMAQQLPNASATNEPVWMVKARIAALVQVIEPEGPQLGRQMVKYLSTLSHIDATRALARIAISAPDDEMRKDAVNALAVRRDADYDEILVNGLNYPWPDVAERTKDAIVKMKRVDLAPKLVDMLERPDPRSPQLKEVGGKSVPVVRELVRVNHLKNCLLCHSPANSAAVSVALPPGAGPTTEALETSARGGAVPAQTALVAPVPLPGQPVQSFPQGGYGQSSLADTLVAFDVTYLRQDFSVKLPVANAQPWPEMQRFDFLVRSRQLSEKDAQAYRDLVRPAAGELTPYQRIAVVGLRQLTGRDAEPNAQAWRQVLAQLKSEPNAAVK